nr:exosome complex component Rrp41 [Andalucia godoyi]
MMRKDGRSAYEIRDLHAELSKVHSANGSCSLRMGGSLVLACVVGPIEVRSRRDLPDKASLEVSVVPENPVLCRLLQSAFSSIIMLSRFPHSGIDISVDLVHIDGSVTSCAFNTVMLALLDAGLPCHFVACGLDICFSRSTSGVADALLVDPTLSEETSSESEHVFSAFNVASSSLISSWVAGSYTPKELSSILEVGSKKVPSLRDAFRNVISLKFRSMLV